MNNWFSKARTFLVEVRSELKKCTFPTRREVISTTIVVVVTSVIFAAFLWVADAIIIWLYQGLNTLFKA